MPEADRTPSAATPFVMTKAGTFTAEAVERLDAENMRLRAALREIAEHGCYLQGDECRRIAWEALS